jgi:vancomycin resistance protein YoaR
VSRGVRVAGISAGAVVVLGIAVYLLGYFVTGDRVPRNVTVAGVAVGGLTREDAIVALEAELAPLVEDEIELSINKEKTTLDPADAGLSVDYEASVETAGIGKSFDPRRMWQVLTGGREIEPVIIADQQKLEQAMGDLAEEYDVKPRSAKVSLDGADIETRDMRTGVTVDQVGAAEAISAGLLAEERVTVPVKLTKPEITDAEVDKLVSNRLEPALSGPITLTVDDAGQLTVTESEIADALKITNVDGAPKADLQAKKLLAGVESQIAELDVDEPEDATVKISGGEPVVVPGEPGETVTAEHLTTAVEGVLTADGTARTATVELTEAEPEFSTKDAEALGIEEVTGEFTTEFPYAEYRNVNIGRAAEKIHTLCSGPTRSSV